MSRRACWQPCVALFVFEPLAPDLDGEQWLASTEQRYEAIGRAQSRSEDAGADLDVKADFAAAESGDFAPLKGSGGGVSVRRLALPKEMWRVV